ncbi:tail fiber protein [Caulobacter phage Cd1]|uniref:Tail fiber protein n=1 Tax=Caulobacter phage Cd1 TaxID=718008 RepID=F1ADS2_9CAUD|nr:tail fiber protein [Caulobacter phage Cd1]
MATDPMLDPDYKYSINKFTGNGSKTSWDLNFSGGYIRREHVKAYTEAADGQITELSFTWSGPNTIVITPPVANGLRLFVYRDTPKNGPLVDFTDGAIINEYDLDMLARQTVFATAEMVDRFADVAIQADGATVTATEALVKASAAQVDVAAATTASQAALTTAQSANTKATSAETKANSAVSTAGSANSKADQAISTANLADGKATSALSQSGTASSQSAEAKVDAAAAVATASQANARALNAETVAGQASVTASSAEGTAVQVRTEFDDLRETVEEIAGGGLSNFVKTNSENRFTEVQRFSATGKPGLEIWDSTTFDNAAIRFGPRGGVSFAEGGVWGNGSFANLKDALYKDRAGSLPSLTFTGTALQSTIVPSDTSLRITVGTRMFKMTSSGNLSVGGTFYADTNKPVWHSGNLNPASFALAGHTHSWGEIQGKPTTFPPSVHDHPQYALNSDAVLISATNLGKTGNSPLISGTREASWWGDLPNGYNVMTNLSTTSGSPLNGYGYFFKMARRDNSNGWTGLWANHSSSNRRLFVGNAQTGSEYGKWAEVWTSENLATPVQKSSDSAAGALLGITADPKLAFSPDLGSTWYNTAIQNRDSSFRDVTVSRGDGTGALFMGGGAFIFHNTAGIYEFGGNKDLQLGGTARLRYGGGRQPRITVQSNAPTAELVVGDLWAW